MKFTEALLARFVGLRRAGDGVNEMGIDLKWNRGQVRRDSAEKRSACRLWS